ncbi:MAG: DUF4238 domain-containing protein [Promethearchaeota archaeon]
MPKQKKKHTHTVQKEYLKNFAVEENGKFFLWRLDKKTGKIIRLAIDIISVENYFYPQDIEEWLANSIEARGISAIKKVILQKSISKLTSLEKENIARWIIVQDLRTKEYRNELEQGIEQMAKKILDRQFLPQEITENIQISMGSDPIKNIQMSMMKKLQKYAPIIAKNYHWTLIKNDTKTLYYTSDHPVVRDNSYLNVMKKIMNHKTLGSGRGYFSKGVEFHLPLNSNLKLVLMNLEPLNEMLREIWNAINENPEIYRILWIPFPHKKIKQLRSDELHAEFENILNFNEKITGWSNRFILSKDNDFKIAQELLKRRPDFKNENRKRWEID